MRNVMPNTRFGSGSTLGVIVFAATLAFSAATRASEISDEFLDILVGAEEPAPVASPPLHQARKEDNEVDSPGAAEQYEQDLKLAHKALIENGFQVVELRADIDSGRLDAALYNPRISGLDRTIGRAARILNLYAPQALQTLLICYVEGGVLETLCYRIDRIALNLYLDRLISRWQLRHYVKREEYSTFVRATPTDEAGASSSQIVVRTSDSRADPSRVDQGLLSGYSIYQSNRLGVLASPVDIGHYLNDQHGNLFLDVKSQLSLEAYLGGGWSFNSSVFYRWFAPDNAEASDSLLHKVRSNIDLYRKSDEAKIDTLSVSYSAKTTENSYFNASLGYLEEMFGGLSTQFYMPKVHELLDLELRADWVRQRDIGDPQSFEDYDVFSALLGMRLRLGGFPNDMRVYAGRFLAKDEGIRFDIGHRFSNGVRVAAWYSYTNEKDETGPGSPGDPYREHGISLTVPLNALTRRRDSRKVYNLAYLPHVRDTAQMLHSGTNFPDDYQLKPGPGNQLQQFGQ